LSWKKLFIQFRNLDITSPELEFTSYFSQHS
jgi:hypothetical protein